MTGIGKRIGSSRPALTSEYETSLGYVRSCLQKTKILTQNGSDDILETGCTQVVFCFQNRLGNGTNDPL